MLKKVFFITFIILFFASCSSFDHKKLKISATTWIGYSPLFYAKEKGWLEPLNIKLLNVTSLSENMYLYRAGNADAYVGTQYEYNVIIKKEPSLVPVIMFDHSSGGDLIMSNNSIKELVDTNDEMDVYLEMDSINNTLFKDFIEHYKLKDKTINYINSDQISISLLEARKMQRPTVIVTYNPYDNQLRKQGFKEIISTKDGLELLVFDAMFTTQQTLHDHKEQFEELKKLVDKASAVLETDPYEFYTTVKPYLLEISYEEFQKSLKNIVWINKKLPAELKQRIQATDISLRDLI